MDFWQCYSDTDRKIKEDLMADAFLILNCPLCYRSLGGGGGGKGGDLD